MRPLLLPASWLYGGVIALRNAAFDSGLFRTHDVGIPVISVGNISAGGTGKTPLVEETARMLAKHGVRTGILSRGYGRESVGFRWVRRGTTVDTDSQQCGDEPVQLALNLREAFVAVCEDRVEGAQTMIAEEGIGALVLDDAFQHRWIGRCYDVVVMTAPEVLERGVLLPAGRLREPMSSLRRAQAVVVTGCVQDNLCMKLRERLGSLTDLDIFYTYPVLTGFRDAVSDRFFDAKQLARKRILAVSGIGNPSSFRESLARAGMDVVSHIAFGDHHEFTPGDLYALRDECRRETCDAVVMTQKDVVRLKKDAAAGVLKGVSVYYALMRLEWIGGGSAYEREISTMVTHRKDT